MKDKVPPQNSRYFCVFREVRGFEFVVFCDRATENTECPRKLFDL